LIINCVVNTIKVFLLRFFIFRVEGIKDDYIKKINARIGMAMQKKIWMTSYLFKAFSLFFTMLICGSIFLINKHPLILNGHSSHLTLEKIKQSQTLGLNMVILSSHTSHAL